MMTGQRLAVIMIDHVARLHPTANRNQQLMMTVGLLCQVIAESGRIDDYTLQELMKLLDYNEQ